MSIIWDEILESHDIKPKGAVRAQLDKYIDDGSLPNQNVTAAQAEAVIKSTMDSLLLVDGVHLYIHIFSFPKKTQETNPFDYVLWVGEIGTEPFTNWWEGFN